MRGLEHIIFCYILFFPLIISLDNSLLPVFLIGFLIGSLLPDIDERGSLIYKISKSKYIKYIFIPYIYLLLAFLKALEFLSGKKGHRGISHTLIFGIIIFIITLFLTEFLFELFNLPNFSQSISISIFLGYISHLIGDSYTKSGVIIFYPFKIRFHGKYITGRNSFIPIFLHIVPLLIFISIFIYIKNDVFAFLTYIVSILILMKISIKISRISNYR